jgi:hypothetical protein
VIIALTFGFYEKFAIRALMRYPPSDSIRIVVGVDLNHRSPGYEPGGMDLATLPRFQKHNASALI